MNGRQAIPTPPTRPAARPRTTLRLPTAGASASQLLEAINALLDAANIDPDMRTELLGGAFVAEAVRPHWAEGRTAAEAHDALRHHDPELADAVEALSPMLLGRAQAHADAGAAIDAIEAMFEPGR